MTDTGETTFSPNSANDTAIKDVMPCFDAASQRRIREAILSARKAAEKHHDENTDAGSRHIFREFIPASILNRSGFALEYENLYREKHPIGWMIPQS